MAIVTVTYPNGVVVEAIVLSHEDNEIRAVAAGSDDVLVFTRIHGTWISEEIEPVAIEFAWQRRVTPSVCSEKECLCPKELAARLTQMPVLRGEESAELDKMCEFSPAGVELPFVVLSRTHPKADDRRSGRWRRN